MLLFAVESSCDEMSAAVVESDGDRIKTLSNIVSSQIEIHALYGGVVPEIASRAHCEAVSEVARQAFDKAGIEPCQLDACAVTFAPGLIGSLLVGVCFTKSLASVLNVPVVPVNHIEAHVSAAYLEHEDLKPPFLALVVSGGHTSIYHVTDYNDFNEIGGTRDDACGEAFDKVGRVMGLPYPGGAAMDRLAAQAFMKYDYNLKTSLNFPTPAVQGDNYDFSFSGLKTAVINHLHNEEQKNGFISDDAKLETAGAFTKVVCDGITEKLGHAIRNTGIRTVVMAGGVAANSHLRKAVSRLCEKNKTGFIVPSISLCGDNAAMTAAAGVHLFKAGIFSDSTLNAFASDEAAEDFINSIR